MEKKINTKAKKEIALIFLSVFFISLVSAIPPIPDHFIGNVTINGQDAPVETLISIYVNFSLESVYSILEEGKYDLYVTTESTNDIIEFKIQDILAGNSTRQGGETIFLDLSATITTPPPSSSGSSSSSGGGGGGGGYISPPITKTNESSGENLTNEDSQEAERQEEINPGITSAVIGFLDSGKGNIVIAFVIILSIGVMLIKFKPRKWTKKISH